MWALKKAAENDSNLIPIHFERQRFMTSVRCAQRSKKSLALLKGRWCSEAQTLFLNSFILGLSVLKYLSISRFQETFKLFLDKVR
jgi:hypothetical protein